MIPAKQRTAADCLKDLVLAVALAAVAIVALTQIDPADAPADLASGGVTFATLPLGAAGLLLALTCLYGLTAIREYLVVRRLETHEPPARLPWNWVVHVRRVATIGVLALYVMALRYVPFLVATPIFLFVMFWVYGQRSLWRTAVIAVLGGLALHGIFIMLLRLPL